MAGLDHSALVKIREACTSPFCRRIGISTGKFPSGRCVGYHCAWCGEPCSEMGHDCPAREAGSS